MENKHEHNRMTVKVQCADAERVFVFEVTEAHGGGEVGPFADECRAYIAAAATTLQRDVWDAARHRRATADCEG